MKKIFFLVLAIGLTLSACSPAAATSPAPASVENLEGTAAVLSQQTLQSLPSQTLAPSETPVVVAPTATETPTQAVPTETQNPVLLTLTATLGAGSQNPVSGATSTVTSGTTPSATPNTLANGLTPTTTAHPQHYGTMPPYLPYGQVTMINKSKTEVYISLQCTTIDGYTTILEYPVKGRVKTQAPAGYYTYVVWVGGNQIIGNFKLNKLGDVTINIYKDKVQVN